MAGEVETLDEKAQQAVNSQVEAGRIQVEGIFAAQEVRERYVTAERILLQANAFNSVLEAEGEVRVDGDVVGGAVSCAGLLQVRGNLGNEAGAPTRLRVATEPPGAEKRTALTAEFRRAKGRQVECETALGEHDDDMAARGKTSAYWAGLLKGEKLAPRNPLEKRLLSQFLEAVKAKKRLEQEAEDARLQARDLGNLLVEDAAEAAEATSEDLQIRVGGTVYPGVRCELLQPLAADDLQQAVRLATGEESNLQAVRARLLEALNHHLELYQEAVEERQAALDEIFKDQEEKRPEAPQIPNKRFEEKVLFPAAGEGQERSGVVFVQAHAPQDYYLLKIVEIKAPLHNAVLSIEQDGALISLSQGAAAEFASWQRDTEVLAALDEPYAYGASGRDHLLA